MKPVLVINQGLQGKSLDLAKCQTAKLQPKPNQYLDQCGWDWMNGKGWMDGQHKKFSNTSAFNVEHGHEISLQSINIHGNSSIHANHQTSQVSKDSYILTSNFSVEWMLWWPKLNCLYSDYHNTNHKTVSLPFSFKKNGETQREA